MGGLKLRIDKEYIVCALDQKPQKIDFTSVLCVFKTAHIIIWLCTYLDNNNWKKAVRSAYCCVFFLQMAGTDASTVKHVFRHILAMEESSRWSSFFFQHISSLYAASFPQKKHQTFFHCVCEFYMTFCILCLLAIDEDIPSGFELLHLPLLLEEVGHLLLPVPVAVILLI